MKIYQGPPVPYHIEVSELVEQKYKEVRYHYPAIDDALEDIFFRLERSPLDEGLRHLAWPDRNMFVLSEPGLIGLPKTRWLYEVDGGKVILWSMALAIR